MNYADTTYRSNASKFVKNQLRALPFRKMRKIRYYTFVFHPEPVVIDKIYTKNGVITTYWNSRLAEYYREQRGYEMARNEMRYWYPGCPIPGTDTANLNGGLSANIQSDCGADIKS